MDFRSAIKYVPFFKSRRFRLTSMTVIFLLSAACWPATHSHAADAIRVAALFSYSGAAASSNLPSVMGTRWAVKEINQHGGVLGRRIRLVELDNRGTPIGGKVAADQAIRDDVTAIIGPAWSSPALAAAREAQAAGVPMIVNSATHPRITKIGPYIFRVCYNDLLQGRVLGRFARLELKAASVVILQDARSDYSLGLAATFKTVFERLGGTVSKVLDYKAGQLDFKPMLEAAKAASPDVVFLPGHDESGAIIAQARRVGLTVPFLGGDGWEVASFFTKGGNQLASGYYATQWNESIDSQRSKAFAAKYKNAYPFLSPAALSYDAVYLLADAIRRAGSTDRRAIRDALAQTHDFQGVTGKLTFDSNGDALKSVIMMKISAGKPSYLKCVRPGPFHSDSAPVH